MGITRCSALAALVLAIAAASAHGQGWTRVLEGGGPADTASTSDGGFVVAGDLGGLWLVKVDATGAIAWQKAYGGDGASLVREAPDGSLFAGSNGASGLSLAKLDASGTILWRQLLPLSATPP